jgi:hypothetical protein
VPTGVRAKSIRGVVKSRRRAMTSSLRAMPHTGSRRGNRSAGEGSVHPELGQERQLVQHATGDQELLAHALPAALRQPYSTSRTSKPKNTANALMRSALPISAGVNSQP